MGLGFCALWKGRTGVMRQLGVASADDNEPDGCPDSKRSWALKH